jgi:hypothetical protein
MFGFLGASAVAVAPSAAGGCASPVALVVASFFFFVLHMGASSQQAVTF